VKTAFKVLMAVVVVLATPALALAQNYQPVEGRVRESIPAAPFLAAAYAFMWVAVVVYVVLVARRLGRVQSDIEELRRRLEREAGR
jgi:amino acid transporter